MVTPYFMSLPTDLMFWPNASRRNVAWTAAGQRSNGTSASSTARFISAEGAVLEDADRVGLAGDDGLGPVDRRRPLPSPSGRSRSSAPLASASIVFRTAAGQSESFDLLAGAGRRHPQDEAQRRGRHDPDRLHGDPFRQRKDVSRRRSDSHDAFQSSPVRRLRQVRRNPGKRLIPCAWAGQEWVAMRGLASRYRDLGGRTMSDSIDRRQFLGMAAASALAAERAGHTAEAGAIALGEVDGGRAVAGARRANPFLTGARDFVDVSRGNPMPHTLKGEALAKARLTPETWRLEIVGDGSSEVARPCRLEDGTALDLAALKELGKTHGVKFLKAMQCNNIPSPLGQGLWEGVPLREVLAPRRQGRERPPGLLLGLPQRRPGPALPVVAAVQPGAGDAPRGAAAVRRLPAQRRGRSRWSAAGRCGWSCPGRTASSRSSGCSGSC